MKDWKARYWGMSNYDKLLYIKKKYDPEGIFYCYHCIGSEEVSEGNEQNLLIGIITTSVGAAILLIGVVIYKVVIKKKERLRENLILDNIQTFRAQTEEN